MRELYESLRPKEVRMLYWSAAAAATAFWFSLAWRDARVLLAVPIIGGSLVLLVRRNRRLDPMGHAEEDEEFF